jgi:hypothetical protein
MTQLITEKFQAALKHLLDQEGRGAQTRLATQQGIDRGYLNAIVKGRVAGSDAIRARIADHFETTFEDMLALGRQILEEEGGVVPKGEEGTGKKTGTSSPNIIKFQDKSLQNNSTRISGEILFEALLKALEVLQEASTRSDTLIGSIDVFHEAVVMNKQNLALSDRVMTIESRVANIESVLSDPKTKPRKLRKARRLSMGGI